MISNEEIENWLTVSSESESLEFKAAPRGYRTDDILKYCVAFSNEEGGNLVLGITDKIPRRVVGTQAFSSKTDLNKLKLSITNKLNIRVGIHEITYFGKRILVFEIPRRPAGDPLSIDGRFLMRSGGSLTSMTSDRLKEILTEDPQYWLKKIAINGISEAEVISLLNTHVYFDLREIPYPSTGSRVLQHLKKVGFVENQGAKWAITNMGAILLANDLKNFPIEISRKAVRFVQYKGANKTKTIREHEWLSGYVISFGDILNFVYDIAPQNHVLEEAIRTDVKMFPRQSLRELIANALIHQDFSISGASVMIEMYDDRVEISNPGKPIVETTRFIDDYKSRNEVLADVMRQCRICEEKGSGIDKVIFEVELYQLPAPDFRGDSIRTAATLFSHVDFAKMSKKDRIRACYQHCCLRHVSNKRLTNSSLRVRFQVGDKQVATVSQIIQATKKQGLIKHDENEPKSNRYANYLPFWG